MLKGKGVGAGWFHRYSQNIWILLPASLLRFFFEPVPSSPHACYCCRDFPFQVQDDWVLLTACTPAHNDPCPHLQHGYDVPMPVPRFNLNPPAPACPPL